MQNTLTVRIYVEDIIDRICNVPVEGAIVSVQGSEDSKISDVNGEVSFILPPGTYTINAYKDGLSGSTVIDTTVENSCSICMK